MREVANSENINSIGALAFSNCSALQGITFGKHLQRIGDGAFYNCSRLKTVYYAGTAEEWANIEIDNTNNRNSYLINATKYYYSEIEPTEEGKFWHYVDGKVVVW